MSYEITHHLLEAIASANKQLTDLYFCLRSKPEAKQAHRGFDLKKYDVNLTNEMFVEVEVDDNLAYCWWLDIHFYQDSWSIDAALLRTQNGEQKQVASIAKHSGDTIDSLVKKLDLASQAVVDSARKFHLS